MQVAAPSRAERIVFAAGLCACTVARLPWRRPEGGQQHLALAEEAVAPVVALALVAVVLWRRAPLAWDRVTGFVVALLALDLLSGSLASHPWGAARASGLMVCGVAVFLVARTVGPTGLGVALPAVALIAGATLAEGLGLTSGWSRAGHAPGGLLGERNAAAHFLIVALPCAVMHFVVGSSPRARGFAFVSTIAAAAAITITRTRSAWLAAAALALLGVVFIVSSSAVARRRAILLAVASVVVVVAVVAARPAIRWASRHPYRDTVAHLLDRTTPSAHGRLVQYSTSLRLLYAHPLLGVGPGNWATQYLGVADAQDPTLTAAPWPVNRLPTSDAIGFLVERGLAGALLLGLLVAGLLHAGRCEAPLRWATLLAIGVVCTLDAVLTLAPHALLVAWVLGCATPIHEPPKRSPVLAPLLALVLVVVGVLAQLRVIAFARFLHARDVDAMVAAARLDPADLPLRLFIAEVAISSSRCDLANQLLAELRSRSVEPPAARSLATQCAR